MDEMLGTMTGDMLLGRRLEAFAELRLSPDLATSARLRARVLSVAHRRAALSRVDAGLTILSRPEPTSVAMPFSAQARAQAQARRGVRPRRQRFRRVGAVVLAASFAVSLAVAGVAAARLWAETLQLPTDPSARAIAELDRLKTRLLEIGEASRAGDSAGLMAALQAYQRIVDEASTSAILAGDEVAAAALQTGVGHNVEVLEALLGKVPSQADAAISTALGRPGSGRRRRAARRRPRSEGNEHAHSHTDRGAHQRRDGPAEAHAQGDTRTDPQGDAHTRGRDRGPHHAEARTWLRPAGRLTSRF